MDRQTDTKQTDTRQTDTRQTIILAGYKDDIEQKLFEFNDGFNRRFNLQITFEDYTEPELANIFRKNCDEYKWPPKEGEDVVGVAARRLGRGRGRRGFGNAGDVRKLFEAAYRRALERDPGAKSLTVVDVIGPPPTREHVPELGAALDELNDMIGLRKVKESIHQLVNLAQTNYQRELDSRPPFPVVLNRVFLGNPGTGKTTVAKLYGRILKAVGLLSDGKCELKQPSDLTGGVVGETAQRTSALVRRCMGKVLIVDEAYTLNDSRYGHEAITTLVGLVHGAPGEDIAVVLIGYEKQMCKMFREANPGLARRFGLRDAFIFEDFDDRALDRVVLSSLQKAGLRAPKSVRKEVIKALAVKRGPNFGNAGEALGIVAQAKQRLSSRDSNSTALTLEDFGLDRTDGDGMSVLDGLYNIDHIREHLYELKTTLQQLDRDGKDRSEHLESYVFLGNPGTGKTTVARSMAHVLHEVGVLSRPFVKAVSGLDMQGSYLGQTKDKVNDMMDEAQGGVLFIDEAYSLGQGRYSSEAVDQLVALMTSEQHLNKTVVILAGYKQPMERMLGSNEGLRSRFTGRIEFPDWGADDCVEVIRQRCEAEGTPLTYDAVQVLSSELWEIQTRPGWGNARDSVTVYRLLYKARAQRCAIGGELEPSYVEDDVTAAMAKFGQMRPLGERIPLEEAMKAANDAAQRLAAAVGASEGQLKDVQPEEMAQPGKDQVERQDMVQTLDAKEIGQVDPREPDIDPTYAALLQACVAEGYDSTHERRKELVAILIAVQGGNDFPDAILERVTNATGLSKLKVHEILKPQIHQVLEAMSEAVQEEETRREEMRRLEREKKEHELKQKQEVHRKMQEALQQCGACPMGFSWIRCGSGWRCTGGSHYKSDAELMLD